MNSNNVYPGKLITEPDWIIIEIGTTKHAAFTYIALDKYMNRVLYFF